jgi:hypothetical protein
LEGPSATGTTKLKVLQISAHPIETTVDISSTELAYILGSAKTAAKDLSDELRSELVDLRDANLNGANVYRASG